MAEDWGDGKAAKVSIANRDGNQAKFTVYDNGRVIAHTQRGEHVWNSREEYELDREELAQVIDPIYSEADQATGKGGHLTPNEFGVEVHYQFNPDWNPSKDSIEAAYDEITAENHPEVYSSISILLENHPLAEESGNPEEIFENHPNEIEVFVNNALENKKEKGKAWI